MITFFKSGTENFTWNCRLTLRSQNIQIRRFFKKFHSSFISIKWSYFIMENTKLWLYLSVASASIQDVFANQQPGVVLEMGQDRGHGHGHVHFPNKVGPDNFFKKSCYLYESRWFCIIWPNPSWCMNYYVKVHCWI